MSTSDVIRLTEAPAPLRVSDTFLPTTSSNASHPASVDRMATFRSLRSALASMEQRVASLATPSVVPSPPSPDFRRVSNTVDEIKASLDKWSKLSPAGKPPLHGWEASRETFASWRAEEKGEDVDRHSHHPHEDEPDPSVGGRHIASADSSHHIPASTASHTPIELPLPDLSHLLNVRDSPRLVTSAFRGQRREVNGALLTTHKAALLQLCALVDLDDVYCCSQPSIDKRPGEPPYVNAAQYLLHRMQAFRDDSTPLFMRHGDKDGHANWLISAQTKDVAAQVAAAAASFHAMFVSFEQKRAVAWGLRAGSVATPSRSFHSADACAKHISMQHESPYGRIFSLPDTAAAGLESAAIQLDSQPLVLFHSADSDAQAERFYVLLLASMFTHAATAYSAVRLEDIVLEGESQPSSHGGLGGERGLLRSSQPPPLMPSIGIASVCVLETEEGEEDEEDLHVVHEEEAEEGLAEERGGEGRGEEDSHNQAITHALAVEYATLLPQVIVVNSSYAPVVESAVEGAKLLLVSTEALLDWEPIIIHLSTPTASPNNANALRRTMSSPLDQLESSLHAAKVSPGPRRLQPTHASMSRVLSKHVLTVPSITVHKPGKTVPMPRSMPAPPTPVLKPRMSYQDIIDFGLTSPAPPPPAPHATTSIALVMPAYTYAASSHVPSYYVWTHAALLSLLRATAHEFVDDVLIPGKTGIGPAVPHPRSVKKTNTPAERESKKQEVGATQPRLKLRSRDMILTVEGLHSSYAEALQRRLLWQLLVPLSAGCTVLLGTGVDGLVNNLQAVPASRRLIAAGGSQQLLAAHRQLFEYAAVTDGIRFPNEYIVWDGARVAAAALDLMRRHALSDPGTSVFECRVPTTFIAGPPEAFCMTHVLGVNTALLFSLNGGPIRPDAVRVDLFSALSHHDTVSVAVLGRCVAGSCSGLVEKHGRTYLAIASKHTSCGLVGSLQGSSRTMDALPPAFDDATEHTCRHACHQSFVNTACETTYVQILAASCLAMYDGGVSANHTR